MGCSLPSFASPSTVVISPPSAIGANNVHDFTVRPFKITVQAPQYVVSHPTCVPVRLRCSRKNSTSSVRGSTSATRASPFTRTRTRIFLASGILMPRIHRFTASPPRRDPDSAFHQGSCQHPLVIRRSAHVALRICRRPCRINCNANILLIQRLPPQRCLRLLRANRRKPHAPQNDPRVLTRILTIQ